MGARCRVFTLPRRRVAVRYFRRERRAYRARNSGCVIRDDARLDSPLGESANSPEIQEHRAKGRPLCRGFPGQNGATRQRRLSRRSGYLRAALIPLNAARFSPFSRARYLRYLGPRAIVRAAARQIYPPREEEVLNSKDYARALLRRITFAYSLSPCAHSRNSLVAIPVFA